jgi:tRNA (cytidine/uridine-2'-O-)-methyltransferase
LIHIALYEPEIPGNTGNIARLAAASGSSLHLIGRMGFSLQHPEAKRAGMDYWQHVDPHRHINYADFEEEMAGNRLWLFSTHATTDHWDAEFRDGDALVFGPESRGLPGDLVTAAGSRALRIPMWGEVRSLNIASAAAVALYEALRQIHRPQTDRDLPDFAG